MSEQEKDARRERFTDEDGEQRAWWCPKCRVGVELGEAAWQGSVVAAGSAAVHFECGTELRANL